MGERSEMLMAVFANKSLKFLQSQESLNHKYVWVLERLPKVARKLPIFPQRRELFIASETCLGVNAFSHLRREKNPEIHVMQGRG